MRTTSRINASVLCLLLVAAPSTAADAELTGAARAWVERIGHPPAADSQTAHEDLAIVLWVQRTRSASDVDRVWAAMSPGVGTFQQAIGTMLLPQRFPKLYAAVQAGLAQASPPFEALKSHWRRPRPAAVDPDVKPCTPTPESGSYPSGTAALGIVAGRLLADLIPARKAEILERGEEIGELRVTAGVHFPSDVVAGAKLGELIADQILASEQWAKTREALADELAALRKRLGPGS